MHFLPLGFFSLFPCIFTLFSFFFTMNNTDFCLWKKNLKLKKTMFKKIQLGFSSNIKVPSSAWLGSDTFQLDPAQLRKFQLELIIINHQYDKAKLLLLKLIHLFAREVLVTSVTQKNVPSAIVYHYCAWYVFLRDRHYLSSKLVTKLKSLFSSSVHKKKSKFECQPTRKQYIF